MILDNHAFYREAPVALQAEIRDAAKPVRVGAGAVLLEPGGRADVIHLAGAGSIRVFVDSETGREVTLYRLGRGELCPVSILAAIARHRSPAKVVCETAVDAVAIPALRMRGWIEAHPGLRSHVIDTVALRFVQVMEQIQQITFGRLDQRLVEFLERKFDGAQREIRITHEQIAADLSTAREVVSRLLREFERQGAVYLGRGRITLRSTDALRRCVTRAPSAERAPAATAEAPRARPSKPGRGTTATHAFVGIPRAFPLITPAITDRS